MLASCFCICSTIFFALTPHVGFSNDTSGQEPTEISLWHSFAGQPKIIFTQLVQAFNQQHPEFNIVLQHKGSYTETLTSAAAAYRAHRQPAILQVFEVGTATMMQGKKAVLPLHRLEQRFKVDLQTHKILTPLREYYSDSHAHLAGLPFNSSSVVMFYNQELFKRAHITAPPRTWAEFEIIARKLQAAGSQCALTTTWPSWILLEQYSAWNNLPFATLNNGFGGIEPKLLFNNPQVQHFLERVRHWQEKSWFRYSGRENASAALFTSGTCAMILGSSSSRADLHKHSDFWVVTAPLPYDETLPQAPQNTLLGGGALWVLNGHSDAVYQGVLAFYHYWLSTPVQTRWAKATGYLPVTQAAYQALKDEGYYKKQHGAETALRTLLLHPPSQYSRGIRIGNYPLVRYANLNALESALSGKKSVSEALTEAVAEGNYLIHNFARNNRPNEKH